MILLIAGSSYTGKPLQRSGICSLTPDSSDDELTPYLWNIVKEMIKTAIEKTVGEKAAVEKTVVENTECRRRK